MNCGVFIALRVVCAQERIQANVLAIEPDIVDSVLYVIERVTCTSSDTLHHVMSLWDFLLLVHPAASTFIRHREQDFYFRLSKGLYGSGARWGEGGRVLLGASDQQLNKDI